MIESFSGEHAFLSNFAPARVHVLIGNKFVAVATVEHAYQAYKTPHEDERMEIAMLRTPSDAKKYGNAVFRLASWDELKVPIMHGLLYEKFQDPVLASKLWDTGDQKLIEGNHWHDQFWGDCRCGRTVCSTKGENMLGKLLMRVRKDLYRAAGEEAP